LIITGSALTACNNAQSINYTTKYIHYTSTRAYSIYCSVLLVKSLFK